MLEAEKKKKLYRSRTDRIIAGVASGLARHFELDPVLMRVLFVVLAFANGFGLVIYIVLMIVVPLEPETGGLHGEYRKGEHMERQVHEEKAKEHNNARRNGLGIALVAVGLIAFLHKVFPSYWIEWRIFWPLLLIAAGLFILLRGKSNNDQRKP